MEWIKMLKITALIQVDWGAARAFCSVIGGELLVLQQYDLFLALTRRLQETG